MQLTIEVPDNIGMRYLQTDSVEEKKQLLNRHFDMSGLPSSALFKLKTLDSAKPANQNSSQTDTYHPDVMALFECAKGMYGDLAKEIDEYIQAERQPWS